MDKIELDEKALEAAVATTPFGPVAREAIGNAIRAYLASTTSEPVAVKALEWRDEPVPPSREWLAASSVGLYCIPGGQSVFFLRFRDKETLGTFDTLGEAKAAAQADYETRIRSALTIPPAAPVAPADGVPISVMIGAEVRRRNRVGADDEKGAISPSCEMAATEIVLSALNDCGFCVSWKPAPTLADATLKATRETA